MTSLDQVTTGILLFSKKLFSLHEGALFVIALPSSYGISQVFSAVIADTAIKDLILPVALAVFLILLYGIIFVIDFYMGTRASKHEAQGVKDWFHSGKAWSSCIKFFIVVIVLTSLAVLSAICAIAGFWGAPTGLLIALGVFGIMASLFDLYSIGENQKRLYGKKDRIFTFLETIGNTIEKGFTTKITNWFAR